MCVGVRGSAAAYPRAQPREQAAGGLAAQRVAWVLENQVAAERARELERRERERRQELLRVRTIDYCSVTDTLSSAALFASSITLVVTHVSLHTLTRATRLLFERQAQAAAERERVLRNLRGFPSAPSAAGGGGGANAYPYPMELPHVGPSELEVVDSRASNETTAVERTPEAHTPWGPSLTLMFEAIGVAVNRAYAQPTADAASEQSELKCAFAKSQIPAHILVLFTCIVLINGCAAR